MQCGLNIAPLLTHVVQQGRTAAHGSGEGVGVPGDAEARLNEDLPKVDAFGMEGAIPVNEQEVKSRSFDECCSPASPRLHGCCGWVWTL